jgi:hypothetical protein
MQGVLLHSTAPATETMDFQTSHRPFVTSGTIAVTKINTNSEESLNWAESLLTRFVGAASSRVDDASAWAIGREPIWRIFILFYIAYAGIIHLIDPHAADVTLWLTICIHELGHAVTIYAPRAVCVAAGSVFQVLGPLYLVIEFFRQRDYFAVCVAGTWLSFSLYWMATYMSDAQAQVLPMINLNGDTSGLQNDWNYMLGGMGILPMCTALSIWVRYLATDILLASFALGCWLCFVMIRGGRQSKW